MASHMAATFTPLDARLPLMPPRRPCLRLIFRFRRHDGYLPPRAPTITLRAVIADGACRLLSLRPLRHAVAAFDADTFLRQDKAQISLCALLCLHAVHVGCYVASRALSQERFDALCFRCLFSLLNTRCCHCASASGLMFSSPCRRRYAMLSHSLRR